MRYLKLRIIFAANVLFDDPLKRVNMATKGKSEWDRCPPKSCRPCRSAVNQIRIMFSLLKSISIVAKIVKNVH